MRSVEQWRQLLKPLVRVNLATEYALRSTVSLAMQDPKGLICAGTGTLFEIEGRQYVLTASHVCDEGDLTTLFIPARGDLGDRIPCSSGRVTRPKDRDDVDVASIELSDVAVFGLIERGYRFVTLDRVDLRGPADPAYIMGYPKKNYPTTGTGVVRAITLQCPLSPTPTDIKPPPMPGLDFFYDYPRSAYFYKDQSPAVVQSPSVGE